MDICKEKIQSLLVAAFPQSHSYLTSDLQCNIKKSNAESRNLASGNKQTIFYKPLFHRLKCQLFSVAFSNTFQKLIC